MSDESGLVDLIVAVPALFASIAAAIIALRSHRTDRSGFLADIRRYWDSLADDWAVSLLYTNGADFYYSPASDAERKRIGRLIAETNRSRDFPFETIRREQWRVRRVVRFFAYAADSLITGKWTLEEAYSLFGPDVARHLDSLLWMTSRVRVRPSGPRDPELSEWDDAVDQLTEFNFYDEQEVVYLFAYLLRAEQCRRGDTYAHFVVELARRLESGEYKKLRAYLKRASKTRRRLWARRSLITVLRGARRPDIRSAFTHARETLVLDEDMKLFKRVWFSTRLKRRRAAKLAARAELD